VREGSVHAGWACRDLGGPGRRECRFTPKPARTESKFIDDHVATLTIMCAARISKAGCRSLKLELQMVTADPVRTDFGECGGAQLVLLQGPGYQQVKSSTGTSGAQCGQLSISTRLETIRCRTCS
jgi:hypothetical protein